MDSLSAFNNAFRNILNKKRRKAAKQSDKSTARFPMIRIDYKIDGQNVLTTWVYENGDMHSMMGRVTFTIDQWRKFQNITTGNGYKFEEKH